MSVYRWREAHCRFFTEVGLSVLRAFRGRSRHDTWSHPIGFRVSRRVRLKEETRTLAMDGNVGSQHIGGQASGKVQGTVREINYLRTCHDALTDVWALGDNTETGISWGSMFSKDGNAQVADSSVVSRCYLVNW